MKLAYFQSCENPLDPLPKLGRKVEPEPSETAEQKRQKAVRAFESEFDPSFYMVSITEPRLQELQDIKNKVLTDMAQMLGTSFINPEPVVSFADAAEMADGWIKWDGGECPVPVGAKVDIRFRDNSEYLNEDADKLRWRIYGDDWITDIIAYRIHKEPEKKAPTFDDWSRAVCAALKNHSLDEIHAATIPVLDGVGHKPGMPIDDFPQAFPALIAALDELRR